MEATWFVVADRSQAQLFEVEGTKLKPTLKPLETIEHPEGRRAEARRSGASSSSGMRDLLTDSNSTQEEQDRKFVRQLLDRLTQAQHQGHFGRLVIAAPADFVGRLRELAARSLSKSVVREIIGDYTNDTVHALQERARQKEWLH
ncbi:MAG: host attachment protein [Myxococcales bacterium]|jgi:protein required for attachment to host cells|nr:host attachment protein [Myxococcales bacterium]